MYIYILGTRAWKPRCSQKDSGTHQLIKQLMPLPYLPAEKIEKEIPSITSSSKQLPDPCRTSAVTSMKIGSVARPSRHWRGACSWKLSGPTMTWRVGTMACTGGPSQLLLYIFIQLLHREALSTCRSVWFQTKSSRDISGWPSRLFDL